jgi:hypothetical protein
MGIAKGQDSQAEEFILNISPSIQLVMPGICFVEGLMTLEQEDKYNQDFLRRLDIQINEAKQDKSSENAMLLSSLLEQSRISFFKRFNDVKQRFEFVSNQLYGKVDLIKLNPEVFQESSSRDILEKHIMDKLILECIIHHARLHPSHIKVFLSSNSKEFGKQEVAEILQNTGIIYFNKTQNFLGWLQSQSI